MNNEQFRRLLVNSPAPSKNGEKSNAKPGATPFASGSLGSKSRSFVPMTPRTVKGSGGVDFAKQLAGRDDRASKKFRSSAPKGSRLAAGYHDRTMDRPKSDDEEDQDDKASRIKALEEQMKLGQIEQHIFEQLRDEITGGDITATHLVKGLDRRLLERVRRGEDVMGTGAKGAQEEVNEEDLEDEFDKLEQEEVKAIEKEKVVKKGQMAPPPVAGVKRSRDAILAELKAQRIAAQEAKAAAQPVLGSRFKKIGQKREESRIETDERGREVLIVVDEQGNVKRKVRKTKPGEQTAKPTADLLEPDRSNPLGMEVPELPPAPEMEEDDDIFEGAGLEYNPLGDDDDEDESSSSDEDSEKASPASKVKPQAEQPQSEEGEISEDENATERRSGSPSSKPKSSMPPPPIPSSTSARRNYFGGSATTTNTNATREASNKAAILSIIAKAKKMDNENGHKVDEDGQDEADGEKTKRLQRKAALLASQDRDFEDMDMGFGSSRFDDAEEFEQDEMKIKLSEWKGGDGDEDESGVSKEKGGKKRKRGPKKRKGDKDSAADVLRVMESRKGK